MALAFFGIGSVRRATSTLYTILYRETAEPDEQAYCASNGINNLRWLNARSKNKSHLRHHPLQPFQRVAFPLAHRDSFQPLWSNPWRTMIL